MCADGSLVTNEHSDLIAELPFSFARLHRNQAQAGYCVVILKGHATELHELDHTRLAPTCTATSTRNTHRMIR